MSSAHTNPDPKGDEKIEASGSCWVPRIEPEEYDWVVRRFREYCWSKGLVEASTQHTLDILSACEDTQNLATFRFMDGRIYPLKQTGQMVLEDELLRKPSSKGYFCITTSYRFEQYPKAGRHSVIFPMAEFEIHGGLDALIDFEKGLLEYLGFKPPKDKGGFPEGDYQDACQRYKTDELNHDHETQLGKDYGHVYFLKHFPENTSPFWNMKRGKEGVALKCDVIMNGIETIGSAERSCDKDEMRKRFYSIMNGDYAKALFDKFGKENVEKELDRFLQHKFIQRSGGGIGITRLIQACKAANLIK